MATLESAKHTRRADDRLAFESWLVRLFWVVPLGFYLATVSRTPGWVDAPLIAKMVHEVELSTWVNNHNLFTLLGAAWLRLVPSTVAPHYALNVLCALLGALTVFLVFRIGLRLTDNPWASALGATVLMMSHSLWWHSTMLEVYTLNTALLATTLLFVIRYEQRTSFRDLCIASLSFGLACSNHPQMSLLGIGFLGLLASPRARRDVLRPKRLGALGLCFLMGFQVYLWVFAIEFVEYARTAPEGSSLAILRGMLDKTTGRSFRQYMFPPGLSMRDRLFWWGFYLGFFVYNFVPPWLLFAPFGALAWLRNPRLRASIGFFAFAWLGQVIWSANYLVWDMYAFSLPAYVLTAVPIIMGIDWVCRRSRRLRMLVFALAPTVVLIPVMYAHVPRWIQRSDRALAALQRIPQYGQATAFWDPLDYFFNPNKHGYDRVERYAATILAQLEPHACFWGSEATMLYPLKYYYQDVLGERPDVSYHLVFGIVGRDDQFERQAAQMVEQLQRGCPVYVSSREFPERNVLNHVYQELSDENQVANPRALSTEELVLSFPKYEWTPLDVDRSEDVKIYRLEQRANEHRPRPP